MNINWSNFHTVNPYKDFPLKDWTVDITGWHSEDPVFERLITELRPNIVVEVGTWKGASALNMARLLRQNGLHTSRICCVDTWLGSLEFWTSRDDQERYGSLMLKHGYPQVYYQFLANVLHSQVEDVIIPFPVPSSLAANWFKLANEATPGFLADLIYLDASHEYRDVIADITMWWDNLRSGGVMFGDDYQTFKGVRDAVNAFVYDRDLETQFSMEENKWVIKKLLGELAGGANGPR